MSSTHAPAFFFVFVLQTRAFGFKVFVKSVPRKAPCCAESPSDGRSCDRPSRHRFFFRFLWPCIVSKVWREKKNQQDATIRCLLLTSVSTCFGHHYAHLQENKGPVTAFGVQRWFCRMWLVAVVGHCVVGCEHCYILQCSAPQPLPTTSSRTRAYTKCSNTVFGLLRMGMMMPKTCWDRSNNKHLIIASCWFFSLFMMNKCCRWSQKNVPATWIETLELLNIRQGHQNCTDSNPIHYLSYAPSELYNALIHYLHYVPSHKTQNIFLAMN